MVALELVREDEDQGTHRCDASELSTSPREEAEAAKARGNESFARGEFERAREAYTEALARVGAEERRKRDPDGSFVDRSSWTPTTEGARTWTFSRRRVSPTARRV